MHYNVRGLLISAFVLAGATGGALTAQTASGTNQNNTQYGTSSAEFLLLGAGARGVSLGGTIAAVATSDASALYYNPGAASMMGRPGLLIGTYDYVGGTRYSWGGLNFPFGGGSNSIGIQIGTFGFNNQPVYTVDQPDGTGTTYSVTETFLGATFARNFSDRFSTGLTLKGVYDQLGSAKGTAFAVDFGTHYHAKLKGHPVNMAFVLSNLGTNLSYSGDGLAVTVPRDTSVGAPVEDPQPGQLDTKGFQLPTNFQIAVSYDLVYTKSMSLTLAGRLQPAAQQRRRLLLRHRVEAAGHRQLQVRRGAPGQLHLRARQQHQHHAAHRGQHRPELAGRGGWRRHHATTTTSSGSASTMPICSWASWAGRTTSA